MTCGMRPRIPNIEEQIAIVRGLLARRRRGEIPPIWTDQGRVSIEVSPGVRRPIGWQQAARLAAGEAMTDVLGVRGVSVQGAETPAAPRQQPQRAEPWYVRRAAYLRRKLG